MSGGLPSQRIRISGHFGTLSGPTAPRCKLVKLSHNFSFLPFMRLVRYAWDVPQYSPHYMAPVEMVKSYGDRTKLAFDNE